jgi:SAM-dependent methyltransferase
MEMNSVSVRCPGGAARDRRGGGRNARACHTGAVPRDRDVKAFHDRAPTYEAGWRGRMHLDIITGTVAIALKVERAPTRVLDVGCGTGALLRLLGDRLGDDCKELVGIDAAAGMIEVAAAHADDTRLRFSTGVAEHLPFPDAYFDLVVSSTSFDHWSDQGAGLCECARVLRDEGHLVLTDLFSLWLLPTLALGHRGHARTKHRASALLRSVGFESVTWYGVYQLIIAAAVATKQRPSPTTRSTSG